MKKSILFLAITVLFFSCNKEEEDQPQPERFNNVVLLQIDYVTNTFEGGKVLEFPSAQGFTISSTYDAPGDIGSVQLYYSEVNEKIFDGGIIWAGTGQRSYPETMESPDSFETMNDGVPLPDVSMFEKVIYTGHDNYPEVIDYPAIWNSINKLNIVSWYRAANPDAKINLFFYQSSVGTGDPADWDWYVILRNEESLLLCGTE